jgi:hypothetical protein
MQVRILPPLPIQDRDRDKCPVVLPVDRWCNYSYLLGMYLGDGYLCRVRRTYRLEVSLNRKDERGIGRVGRAISAVLPGTRVGLRAHGTAVVVTSYSNQWPLFPQHGIGRKHLRRICLRLWQRRIVGQYPEDFIRGCIDSDGCRHRRVVKGHDYPAYSFRNHSDDMITSSRRRASWLASATRGPPE